MGGYGSETTTDEVLAGIDLTGRRVVITGTSSGLGEESTRALAAHGASITLAARNAEKNEAAAARVRERVPGADLELRELDLQSLASAATAGSASLPSATSPRATFERTDEEEEPRAATAAFRWSGS